MVMKNGGARARDSAFRDRGTGKMGSKRGRQGREYKIELLPRWEENEEMEVREKRNSKGEEEGEKKVV